jgi:hypothetical protein
MSKLLLKDVLKNIDSYRGRNCSSIEISAEQKEFLLKCRDHVNPVPFKKVAELWAQIGWGEISQECIRKRYEIAKSKKQ